MLCPFVFDWNLEKVLRGAVWTTDAPFHEMEQAIAYAYYRHVRTVAQRLSGIYLVISQ